MRNSRGFLSLATLAATTVRAFIAPGVPVSTMHSTKSSTTPSSQEEPQTTWRGHDVSLFLSGLFGEQADPGRVNVTTSPSVEWQIYVDHSKGSLDRGASTTLDTFCGLCKPQTVQVIPAILSKSKHKPPWIRIISKVPGKANNMDVANVDSVDKVYRVLTKHLKLKEVSKEMAMALKWKYEGNNYMENGKVMLAIDAYNKALEKCKGTKQEGLVLFLRATAYWKQAKAQKETLQNEVEEWELPQAQDIQYLLSEGLLGGAAGTERAGLAASILEKLSSDGRRQQTELRKIQYRHGLYQYALLHATQDSLRTTEILPSYSAAWLQAGELLGQLWKLKESRQYCEMAQILRESRDESSSSSPLDRKLKKLLGDLSRRQELLEQARSQSDWPEDALRLALDVAG